MGGNKKNNKNKGLTPAKRKEAVKKTLQDLIKNDTEIKKLVTSIQDTDKKRVMLTKEREALRKWSEQRTELKRKADQAQNEANQLLGTSSFEESNPKNEMRLLSIGQVRMLSVKIRNFTQEVKKEKLVEDEKLKKWSSAFQQLLCRLNVTRDQIKLLQGGGCDEKPDKGPRDKIESLREKKASMEKKIKDLQLLYINMSKLDQERQKKYASLTLEEFMDKEMKRGEKKVASLRKTIQTANAHMSRLKSAVSARTQKVKELREAVLHKQQATVEESEHYQKVVRENKELLVKLDELLERRKKTSTEQHQVKEAFADELHRRTIMTADEIQVHSAIEKLEQQYDESVESEEQDEQIADELKRQVWAQDVCLANLRRGNSRLEEEVAREKRTIALLKGEINEMDRQSMCMMDAISLNAHQMAERHFAQE